MRIVNYLALFSALSLAGCETSQVDSIGHEDTGLRQNIVYENSSGHRVDSTDRLNVSFDKALTKEMIEISTSKDVGLKLSYGEKAYEYYGRNFSIDAASIIDNNWYCCIDIIAISNGGEVFEDTILIDSDYRSRLNKAKMIFMKTLSSGSDHMAAKNAREIERLGFELMARDLLEIFEVSN